MKKKRTFILRSIIVVAIIWTSTTLLAYALQEMGFRKENILLVYVIAVMIVIIETKKFWIGFLTSIMCVMTFNYLFTEPQYTFIIDDPNYIVAMIIFILVSFILGSLILKLQKQITITQKNQEKVETLYSMSLKLLNMHSIDKIAQYEINHIEHYLNRHVWLHLKEGNSTKDYYNQPFFNINMYKKELEWCLVTSQICGRNESAFSTINYKLFPHKTNQDSIGVLIVDCSNGDITDEEKQFIQLVISNMTIAIEREQLSTMEERARIEVENEKFKTSLLRSISHDLRTPLTSILTGSSILIDNKDVLDNETKQSILIDINTETTYMANFVENLLNLTRIDANKLELIRKEEIVDDILATVYQRVYKTLGNHKLHILPSKDVLLIYVDAQLILQVFINLIDNAIKHTNANSEITIKYYQTQTETTFEVIDNGGGIKFEHIEDVFSDFTTKKIQNSDKDRGIGLGLSICKGIIEAHNGSIKAENNDIGGATFRFILPNLSKEKAI